MKVSVTSGRKLCAVITSGQQGVFVRGQEHHQSLMIISNVMSIEYKSLEALLAESPERVGVYTGDTLTIQF